jgi:hypothetical protein
MEVSGRLICSGKFNFGERSPSTHWIGPWDCLDVVKKKNISHPGRKSNEFHKLIVGESNLPLLRERKVF